LTFAVLPAAVAGAIWVGVSSGQSGPRAENEKYMFVWTGDQAREASDFLAVLDFNDRSPKYGALVTTVPLPQPGASGNEPHHVGLSADGKVLAAGGLLSVLKGQKEIFFFDISNPQKPSFLSAADPPLSAITDDFYPLPNGGFLVTMMGGSNGAHPGRVVEFDANRNIVKEYPDSPPDHGFNPHGISARPDLNLMLTSDFVCPTTTLHTVPGDLDLRGTLRVWNLQSREIIRTITLPGTPGVMDVKFIPKNAQALAYTAGMTDDQLYLLDPNAGSAEAVFDFSKIFKGAMPQLLQISSDGTRLFVSMNTAGGVAMLDISEPRRPKLLDILNLGPQSGPHYIQLAKDGSRLVVSDYFLNEDTFGKVHAEGDHRVHVARINKNQIQLDPRFNVDFNRMFSRRARPHGIALQ
jgi:selenium-binding protein 1